LFVWYALVWIHVWGCVISINHWLLRTPHYLP
jgi:hypothetical protein